MKVNTLSNAEIIDVPKRRYAWILKPIERVFGENNVMLLESDCGSSHVVAVRYGEGEAMRRHGITLHKEYVADDHKGHDTYDINDPDIAPDRDQFIRSALKELHIKLQTQGGVNA